jgi:hypothetical protein
LAALGGEQAVDTMVRPKPMPAANRDLLARMWWLLLWVVGR